MKVHIIGGGIIGLCAAWYLVEAGCEVTVIEKGDLTEGCSHGNAGMIVPSHFVPLAAPGVAVQGIRWLFDSKGPLYIKPRLSLELGQWLWRFYRSCTNVNVQKAMPVLRDFNCLSRDLYRTFAELPEFDFGLQEKGILMLFRTKEAQREEEELAEKAHTLGLPTKSLTATEVQAIEPNVRLDILGAVWYLMDAHFHSGKFMFQLITSLRTKGVRFLSGREVIDFNTTGHTLSELFLSDGSSLLTQQVVLCAGSWSGRILKKLGIKLLIQDGKGYSMTWENPSRIPRYPALLSEAKVAVSPLENVLRIGGTLEVSNLSPTINLSRVRGIMESLEKYYPELDLAFTPQTKVWHGFRPCSPDGLPYLGRIGKFENFIVATGHAMMGMSLGPATGKTIAELLTGKKTAIDITVLDPNRF